jgi:signal transduction histidine kinase/CheY-like chemotaxis protein
MRLDEPDAAEGGALDWRGELALRLSRAFFVAFAASVPILWFQLTGSRARNVLTVLALLGVGVLALPTLLGKPRGRSLGWFIVIPSALATVGGYALVGFLAGPGMLLTITLMLTGILFGRRVMVGVMAACGAGLAAVAWAMVNGVLAPPHPDDVSMTSVLPWVRSLTISLLGITLFGSLMVAVVARIERALGIAQLETRKREQAERARAEAEIVALEAKQLETVGRLAAGVAHDFNNNLTAIIGAAELLKLELPNEPAARELADNILQSSQRAADLTRQLLAYSRRAQMLQTPTNLHALIEEAASFARRSIDPNVELVTDLSAKNPTVNADGSLLQSAVLNLIVNARDALPEGGIITISTTSIDLDAAGPPPTGPCILLEVLDTGRGIDREILPQIFDPFFTTKPVGKGTGLGLAAVAGTIKSHQGRIEVDSDVGVGSAFRIYLPCADVEPSSSPLTSRSLVRGTGELLLIEDDAMVGLAAVATLRSLGYQVTHAADGQRGVELVRASPRRFRLVLLDLRMPGLSGEATFDALTELVPELPILIWSGYGAEQDVTGMLRRGAAGFVQKPYRIAELSRTIADAIQASRARHTAQRAS